MNRRPATPSATAPLLVLLACALLWSPPALAAHHNKGQNPAKTTTKPAAKAAAKARTKAAPKAPTPVDPNLEGDRARCRLEYPQHALAACVRETQAARADERRGLLGIGDLLHADNALRRCDLLPTDVRPDCMARARGQGTASGSVGGGGVLRELPAAGSR